MSNVVNTLIYRLPRVVLIALGMMLVACNGEELTTQQQQDGVELQPIRMDVVPNGMQTSRALIEDSDDLKQACTPTESGGGGKAIGIWSSYVNNGVEVHNVLGNPTGDVSLTYEEQTEWDNYNGWTYGEEAQFWRADTKYTFNAYYPKDVVNELASSNVETFVLEYNTEHYQEDMMVAYAMVDTGAPDFVAGPVPLNMLHTLSAVRFQFVFMNSDGTTYVDSDKLMACWLENSVSGSGIATTGILASGSVIDGELDGESIDWFAGDYPEPPTANYARRMYAWSDAAGVPFSSTASASTPATSHSTGNNAYADNGGWILVIPQTTNGTTNLCFKLESTGDLEHRIIIPTTTFEPGKRYTYNVRFGQSEVDLTLKIADWNELKSSFNIVM